MKEEFEKELNELSPFLAKLKEQETKEPFRTPKFYFDTLADRVLEQAQTTPPEAKRAPLLSKESIRPYNQLHRAKMRLYNGLSSLLQPRMALASAVLLAIAAWYFVGRRPTIQPLPTETAVISPTEIKTYIEENIEDFDEHLIAEHIEKKSPHTGFTAPDTEGGGKEDEKEILEKPEFTEEELEEYLRENLEEEDLH
jgi:hypothetical protein